jgi:hypothetical protein
MQGIERMVKAQALSHQIEDLKTALLDESTIMVISECHPNQGFIRVE